MKNANLILDRAINAIAIENHIPAEFIRDVLTLSHLEMKTVEEIAIDLDVTVSRVNKTLAAVKRYGRAHACA